MKNQISLLFAFILASGGLSAAEPSTQLEDEGDTVTSNNVGRTQSAPPVISPLIEDIQPPPQAGAKRQGDGTLFDILDGNQISSIIDLQLVLQDDPAEFVRTLSQTKNEFIMTEVQKIKEQFKAIPNIARESFNYFIAIPMALVGHLYNFDSAKLLVANALHLPLIPYVIGRNIHSMTRNLNERIMDIGSVCIGSQSICHIFYISKREANECEEQRLSLHSHPDMILPACIGDLTQLRELYIGRNKIRAFPQWISRLVNLEVLDLSHNELEVIPEKVGRLLNLKSLALKVNKIKTLPLQIGALVGLQNLRLEDNLLRSLPHTITELTNLTTLVLWGNICDQPAVLRSLGFRNITCLSGDDSPISTIPGYCYDKSMRKE